MAIRQNISGDCHEYLVSGRIDGAAANEMEENILKSVKAGAKEIFINLSEADFICSSGIRVVMQYWRQLKGQGKKLMVTRPSPAVDEILAMTGFREAIVEGAAQRT